MHLQLVISVRICNWCLVHAHLHLSVHPCMHPSILLRLFSECFPIIPRKVPLRATFTLRRPEPHARRAHGQCKKQNVQFKKRIVLKTTSCFSSLTHLAMFTNKGFGRQGIMLIRTPRSLTATFATKCVIRRGGVTTRLFCESLQHGNAIEYAERGNRDLFERDDDLSVCAGTL